MEHMITNQEHMITPLEHTIAFRLHENTWEHMITLRKHMIVVGEYIKTQGSVCEIHDNNLETQ